MYRNLPEFVKKGEFCITLPGLKYAYDPFKRHKISARDRFYLFDEMLPYVGGGSVLGLKVGSANISAIDIDNAFNNDGSLKIHAADIISDLNAYTELSPSGTGIRILFKTKTPFDISKFYVKNSGSEIEYYDGKHCLTTGARMVRLSGNVIFEGENIEVDTNYILNKYMLRPINNGAAELDEHEFDLERAKVVAYLVNILPEFYPYNARQMDHKSESDWDLTYVNYVSNYTSSLKEIDYAFRNSRYFKTKDQMHLDKWEQPRYVNGTYERIMNNDGGGVLRTWLDYFNEYSVDENIIVDNDHLLAVLKAVGVIKVRYNRFLDTELDPHMLIGALKYIAKHNITASKWRTIAATKRFKKERNDI